MAGDAIMPGPALVDALEGILQRGEVMAPDWDVALIEAISGEWGIGITANDIIEPSWPGYTRRTIPRAQWRAVELIDGIATSWPVSTEWLEWTNQGTGDSPPVFGYAIIEQATDRLILAVRYAEPDRLAVGPGRTYRLRPLVTLSNA
jgi:hypothetical protein